jgi:queuine/archaeosine tRNA-ribosyltransferase
VQLVASLTLDASLLRKLLQLWNEGGDSRNPFASVLVTPLFASPSTLKLIREELKEKRGSTIYFDSGGYYVQQGKISFDKLYQDLRNFYQDSENQWADWYVLPDHVPTSKDSPEIIEEKVFNTVTASKNLFYELPAAIRAKTIPVVQGHSDSQLRYCIENYISLGNRYLGFGSFDTCGPNQSINRITLQSVDLLKSINNLATHYNLDLHLFGIGSPPAHYLFNQMQVRSFDSLTWLKAAGYGHIFLPFVRGYRIAHRTTGRSYWEKQDFLLWKELTEHQCPFCESFETLSESRLHRMLHNLVAFTETLEKLNEWDDSRIHNIIESTSSTYLRLLERMNGRLRFSCAT